MDTNNEKIAQLIQVLSNAILDCLQKTNGAGVCYIDETLTKQYYLQILLAICEKKQIQLDESIIKDCFVKANEMAAKQYIPWMTPDYWDKYLFFTEDDIIYNIKNLNQLEGFINNGGGIIIDIKNAIPDEDVSSLDPVCTGVVGGKIAELIACFNCVKGARRIFNEVHFYKNSDPNLTIGFGHFAKGNESGLFTSMDDGKIKDKDLNIEQKELGKRAKEKLIQYITYRLFINKTYLQQFIQDPIIKKANKSWKTVTVDKIDYLTLFEMVNFFFSTKGVFKPSYKGPSNYKFDKGQPVTVSQLAYWADQVVHNKNGKDIFPNGVIATNFWFNDIMGVQQTIEGKTYYPALCLKEVAIWQVLYWIYTELKTAKDVAKIMGLDGHYGSVAAMTSWKSTGGGFGEKIIRNVIGETKTNNDDGKHNAASKIWDYYNKNVYRNKPAVRDRQKAIKLLWINDNNKQTKFDKEVFSLDTDSSIKIN